MKTKIFSLIALAAVFLILQLGLTACNTIRGAGEDIEAAGNAIEKKAREHKTY